jgi:hypothetical protein
MARPVLRDGCGVVERNRERCHFRIASIAATTNPRGGFSTLHWQSSCRTKHVGPPLAR